MNLGVSPGGSAPRFRPANFPANFPADLIERGFAWRGAYHIGIRCGVTTAD